MTVLYLHCPLRGGPAKHEPLLSVQVLLDARVRLALISARNTTIISPEGDAINLKGSA